MQYYWSVTHTSNAHVANIINNRLQSRFKRTNTQLHGNAWLWLMKKGRDTWCGEWEGSRRGRGGGDNTEHVVPNKIVCCWISGLTTFEPRISPPPISIHHLYFSKYQWNSVQMCVSMHLMFFIFLCSVAARIILLLLNVWCLYANAKCICLWMSFILVNAVIIHLYKKLYIYIYIQCDAYELVSEAREAGWIESRLNECNVARSISTVICKWNIRLEFSICRRRQRKTKTTSNKQCAHTNAYWLDRRQAHISYTLKACYRYLLV